MTVVFHRNFKKRYRKLRSEEQTRCDERINLFIQNPLSPLLNNHTLTGDYENYRSINIGGDLRAIYEPVSKNISLFVALGTHNELYQT